METRPEFVLAAENKEVGKLTWADGVFRFEGDAEESAKIFLEQLNLGWREWEQSLIEAQDAKTAAAKDAEWRERMAEVKRLLEMISDRKGMTWIAYGEKWNLHDKPNWEWPEVIELAREALRQFQQPEAQPANDFQGPFFEEPEMVDCPACLVRAEHGLLSETTDLESGTCRVCNTPLYAGMGKVPREKS